MFDMITPRGASELVLESPRHEDTLRRWRRADRVGAWMCGVTGLLDSSARPDRDILVSRHHKNPGVACIIRTRG